MKKSGLAHSPLFSRPSEVVTIHPAERLAERQELTAIDDVTGHTPVPPRNHATTTPINRDTMPPDNHDTVIPRSHDPLQQVRNAVKEIGKEAATHRLTVQEKRSLSEVIFRYRQEGVKTSENEIARIALNYLLLDYESQGEKSILAEVLRKLNQ